VKASSGRAPITAIVTAHRRINATLTTIARLRECTPAPDEILVHVDANETACAEAIAQAFVDVRVMVSATAVGPGGGRNLLLREARHSIVSSFDDDAYPMDLDYFGRLLSIFQAFPDAAIVTARVFHVDETAEPPRRDAQWVADFSGGASSYRKAVFQAVGGYVPVPLAYGMEEVDLAMRLHADGGKILETPWLRVFHDTDRKRHAEPAVTAATISNIAVLASLRYPMALWPVGALQCLNRVKWLMTHGRQRGVLTGLMRIPSEIARYRAYRDRLTARAVRSYLTLRRHPVPARWPVQTEAA
jgi:GT2 family glycosyltransferase